MAEQMDGEALARWRQARGWTQARLGQALNVDRVTVARWEVGMRPVPPVLTLALEAIDARLARDTLPEHVPPPPEDG